MEIVIAVDFDGTLVTHEFPRVGQEVPYAVRTLRAWIANGVKIILWTMRSGKYLDDAVQWCKEQGIELYGVNGNPHQDWTTSPKAFAQHYIDDSAVGCPMVVFNQHLVVDWKVVKSMLRHLDVPRKSSPVVLQEETHA